MLCSVFLLSSAHMEDYVMHSKQFGTLIVSLDFELFWGMQDSHTLSEYEDHVLGGRKAIPRLLELFQKHGIHATWATVGFQFAESEEHVREYFPDQKPTYEKPELSSYRCLDRKSVV